MSNSKKKVSPIFLDEFLRKRVVNLVEALGLVRLGYMLAKREMVLLLHFWADLEAQLVEMDQDH